MATTKKTTKKTTRKRASKKRSTRKERAEASKIKSEAGKPRELALPEEWLEDAQDIDQLRKIKMLKTQELLEEVNRLRKEAFDQARSGLVRLAKRALSLEIGDHEVVGLNPACTHLVVMSKGEAKQRSKPGAQ